MKVRMIPLLVMIVQTKERVDGLNVKNQSELALLPTRCSHPSLGLSLGYSHSMNGGWLYGISFMQRTLTSCRENVDGIRLWKVNVFYIN